MNLAALDPASLDRAFPVADIVDRLVPYRTHRTILAFDTNEDYELCLLHLLAGERGLAWVTPDEVREAMARELVGPNPDLGLFRQFPAALVLLDPDTVATVLGEAADAALARESAGGNDEPAAFAPAPRHEFEPPTEPPDPPFEPVEPEDVSAAEAAEGTSLPFMLDETDGAERATASPRTVPAGVACSYCGGALPVGRTVLFCPHCGQNVGMVHCPTCGAEMDVGWRFCIGCGQKVSGLG